MNIDLYKAISYSFNCLNNPKRMKAILNDLYPDKKLEINIIIMIYTSGIAEEIKNNIQTINSKKISYLEQIVNTTGLQKDYVKNGINAWIEFYTKAKSNSVKLPEVNYNAFLEPKLLDNTCKNPKKNLNEIVGFEWDYELNKLNDGYEIVACLICENNIVIPNKINGINVIKIGDNSFKNNYRIKSVKISEGVTQIGDSAFAFCRALTTVELPNSIKTIGKYAFYSTKLENIRFSKDNVSIGYGAFGKCSSSIIKELSKNINSDCFSEIFVEATKKRIKDKNDKDKDKETCIYEIDVLNSSSNEYKICKYIGKNNNKIIIPNILNDNIITCIGKEAFKDIKNVEIVNIDEGIKTIDSSAFQRCENLTTIVLPSTLEEIGNSAFAYTNLNQIISFPNVKEIKARSFIGCANLDKFVFPKVLEIIGRSAFASCGLVEIEIPDSVKSILSSAFYDCKNLKTVKLHEGLQEIGQSAFAKCKNLKELFIPNSVKEIGNNAFAETNTLIICHNGSEALNYACKNLMNFKILNEPDSISFEKKEDKDKQNIEEVSISENNVDVNISYVSIALYIFIFTTILFLLYTYINR